MHQQLSQQLDQQIDEYLHTNWKQMVSDITSLIRIRSVEDMSQACLGAPFGSGPREALTAGLQLAKRMGFATQDLDGYIGIADFLGQTQKQLAIIGHLDVVDAGPGWNFPAFDVTERDGYLIGRGTCDDKAPLIVALHAVHFWMSQGAKFPYTIRVLLGANEETRMDDVKHYLNECAPPEFLITPDAEFPVCYGEKGIANMLVKSPVIEGGIIESIEGGTAINAVPGFASAVVRGSLEQLSATPSTELSYAGEGLVRVRAIGKSAHASTPELGVNAIGILTNYLLANNLCVPVERNFLLLIQKAISHTDGSGLNLQCADDDFGSLTLSCGVIDKRQNQMTFMLDLRYPTTTTINELEQKIHVHAKQAGASIQTDMNKPPFLVDPKSPVVQALLQVYNQVTGERAETFTMGGGTYARMFPHAVSFGPDKPWEQRPSWVGSMHGPDEGMSIELLQQEFRIYVHTIAKLMEIDITA